MSSIDSDIQTGGKRTRPLMTVQPVANDLSLTVDTSCDHDDADCDDLVEKFNKKNTGQNTLICWEHNNLSDIAQALVIRTRLIIPMMRELQLKGFGNDADMKKF
jgi:hypothetical protein